MTFRLLICLASLTAAGFCQVKVDVQTDRSEYLTGEPVFVVVDVKNIGTSPLAYSSCWDRADLTVPGAHHKESPKIYGCYIGIGSGSACGMNDGPLLKPGQTVTFWHLLKDYRLAAGTYDLKVSGRAGLRDTVDGQAYSTTLKLQIVDGTEAELRQRYAPYVDASAEPSSDRGERARMAITEMAQPFLEKTILGFAANPPDIPMVAEALGQIPTDESRADLIALFQRTTDPPSRVAIMRTLAGLATPREMPFFARLLTDADEGVAGFAVLGIGFIGGSEAVRVLEPVNRRTLLSNVAIALGNTKAAEAVPVLIRMYSDPDDSVQRSLCDSLRTLTHYEWCGGPSEQRETLWRNWWQAHGWTLPIFGADQCATRTSLPVVN